jgi:hypothetical protein
MMPASQRVTDGGEEVPPVLCATFLTSANRLTGHVPLPSPLPGIIIESLESDAGAGAAFGAADFLGALLRAPLRALFFFFAAFFLEAPRVFIAPFFFLAGAAFLAFAFLPFLVFDFAFFAIISLPIYGSGVATVSPRRRTGTQRSCPF